MEREIGVLKNCKKQKRTVFLLTRKPPYEFVTVEIRGGKDPETFTFPVAKTNGRYSISAHTKMRIRRKFVGHEEEIVEMLESALKKERSN